MSNPLSLDPVDKSPNYTTMAVDSCHSHRPHEKRRRERGKSDFHGSDRSDKRLWNSAASGQNNHMTLVHRKSPKLSFVWDNIKISTGITLIELKVEKLQYVKNVVFQYH